MMDTVYATSNAHQFTLLSSIVNALMLLPYLFLFTFSGFIADRWPKIMILRITSFSAIPLTGFLTLCYYQGWFWLAFSTTVIMALQSVLNSPAKYGYIREAFGVSNIARLNGMVQAAVIIAIVIGQAAFTFAANAMVAHHLDEVKGAAHFITGFAPLGFALMLLATIEFCMTFLLKWIPAADAHSRYYWSAYIKTRYLRAYLGSAFHKPAIFVCMIGLALFFAINQELLAIYGGYLKQSVGASANFALSSIGVAGIGILIGAVLAGRISRGFIEVGTIPLSTLALCLGLICLSNIQNQVLIVVVMLLYGIFAGILIVPLNALIQFHARPAALGRVLATNNFIQMLAMFAYLMFGILLIASSFSIAFQLNLLVMLGLVGLITSLYFFPQSFVRYERLYQTRRYTHLRVENLSELSNEKGLMIIDSDLTASHWSLLQMASPRFVHCVIWPGQKLPWSQRYYAWRLKIKPIIVSDKHDTVEQVSQRLAEGALVYALFENEAQQRAWSEVVSEIKQQANDAIDCLSVSCELLKKRRFSQDFIVKWQAVT